MEHAPNELAVTLVRARGLLAMDQVTNERTNQRVYSLPVIETPPRNRSKRTPPEARNTPPEARSRLGGVFSSDLLGFDGSFTFTWSIARIETHASRAGAGFGVRDQDDARNSKDPLARHSRA